MQQILIVDDDADIRTVVRESLGVHLGFQIYEAPNGFEAMQIIRRSSITHLICDLEMPKMNGLELINWCSEHKLRIKTLLMSGNLERLSESMSADLYITKPFTPEFIRILSEFVSIEAI